MPHGAAADERLGHLGHGDGALHPGGDAQLFQRVLQGQGVDDRGQHAHVIPGGALDAVLAGGEAAEDIAAPGHHHHLDAQLADFADLAGHFVDGFGANADAPGAAKGLTADFEEDAPIFGLGLFHGPPAY